MGAARRRSPLSSSVVNRRDRTVLRLRRPYVDLFQSMLAKEHTERKTGVPEMNVRSIARSWRPSAAT